MGLLSLLGLDKKQKPSVDEWALTQLKEAGSNLSTPHKIEFVLSFPAQSNADQAAPDLRTAGFDVEVKQDNDEWRCLATKTMVPDLAALENIHRDMDKLAAAFGGRYDGWGTGAEG